MGIQPGALGGEAGLRGGCILVVDPHRDDREFLTHVLLDEDYPVRSASTEAEAFAVIESEQTDLVIADAGLAAHGMLLRLRSSRDLGGAPVILVTDRLSIDLVEGLGASGAADFILKPLDVEELLDRVRATLWAAESGVAQGQFVSRPGGAPVTIPDDLARMALEVLSSIPAWILIVDPEHRVRFANESFLQSRGERLDEIVGDSVGEGVLTGFLDMPAVLERIGAVISTGRPTIMPATRYRREAGDERAVDLRIVPMTAGGEAMAALILHDISEHWFSREAISREKRKLEEIVNGMGAALCVLDRNLHVMWANKTLSEWFGEMWGRRFEYALRGLVMVGETSPEKIFVKTEHVSKEWAHYTASGDKRYYRNIILPTHDEAGELLELVLVIQDLTEVTLRSEQHRLLRDLANLMQSTLDLDRLLYIILTCATAGHALGFNRAFVFLADEKEEQLEGVMGVGPASQEEAFVIWAELAGSHRTLSDLTSDYRQAEAAGNQPLTAMVRELTYPLGGVGANREILARTALENRVQVVKDLWNDERVTTEFRETFGSREFVSVPLSSKGRIIGALLADNIFSSRPISEQQVQILELFAAPAGLAIDNARTYAQLKTSLARRRQAEEALIQSERLATVGRLAAHVAHEIRNPLTTIGGFARSILKKPEDGARVRRSAGIITDEVARLEQILSGVMDFTRPARVEPEPVSMNEILRGLAEAMGPELREAGILLELHLEEGLPICAADKKQILQALRNLVRNAAESLAEHGASSGSPRVRLSTRSTTRGVEVEVEDNGPGLPEDLLNVVFEPFISRKTGGTGLGLAVVRKILLDHGGDVAVDSEAGRGATFVLSFPFEAAGPVIETHPDDDAPGKPGEARLR